jgi:hypothetical protein
MSCAQAAATTVIVTLTTRKGSRVPTFTVALVPDGSTTQLDAGMAVQLVIVPPITLLPTFTLVAAASVPDDEVF